MNVVVLKQLNVLDLQTVKDMGIDPRSLTPTTTKIKGAGRGSKLDVEDLYS